MPGLTFAAGLTVPPIQTYSVGVPGGPKRPVVPTLGLNTVPAAGLFVLRFQIADVALKVIGMVEPGAAWMLLRMVGSVNVIVANAFLLPSTCHSPAPAAVGSTVVATPFGTEPKFRLRRVVIVMPTVTTSAVLPIEALLNWALARRAVAASVSSTHTANRARLMEYGRRRSRARPRPSTRRADRDPRGPW